MPRVQMHTTQALGCPLLTVESLERNTSDFRPDINGLRAIAVIAVVLFHFGATGFAGGFVGVDVFFVISGFLMTKIIVGKLEHHKFSITDFWLSRARRILPALSVLCGVMVLFGWVSLGPFDYQRLAVHVGSSVLFLSNFVFWHEAGYFDTDSKEKWLLHTWSLSVEWQFYLLFPIALLSAWKLFRTRRSLVFAITLAFLFSLATSAIGTKLRPTAAYYLLPTRAWEMMAGGLVYTCSLYFSPPKSVGKISEWVGLVLIFASVAVIDASSPWPGYLALIPVVGTALVIFAKQTTSFITCNRVAGFIGNTSYSIYLWHWPVVVAFYFRGIGPSLAATLMGAALSVLLGYASFRLIELPTRRLWSAKRKSKEIAYYTGVATSLIVLAVLIVKSSGFPERLKTDAISYSSAAAAIDDWGHPGKNCRELAYATRCWSAGGETQLAVFIGDSLAEQWYPRYGEQRARRQFSTLFITKGACLPIRGLGDTHGDSHCAEFANLAWNEVFERKPAKLVIASIWLTYFFDAGGNRRDGVCLVEKYECLQADNDEILSKIFEHLVPDIRRAIDAGTAVYILAPTPQSGFDYPKAKLAELSARGLRMSILADPTESVSENFRVDDRRYSQGTIVALLQMVADRTGAMLILPERYMCPTGICANLDKNGRPIYKDRGHLRKSYVQSDEVIWLDKAIGINP